jgi:hypothetical protein
MLEHAIVFKVRAKKLLKYSTFKYISKTKRAMGIGVVLGNTCLVSSVPQVILSKNNT